MAKKDTTPSLIQYDATNSAFGSRIQQPTITVYRKGKVALNKALALDMKLHKGSNTALLQDANEPDQWYITNAGKTGFNVVDNAGTLSFTAGTTAGKLLDAIEWSDAWARMRVGEKQTIEGRSVWPILSNTAVFTAITRGK